MLRLISERIICVSNNGQAQWIAFQEECEWKALIAEYLPNDGGRGGNIAISSEHDVGLYLQLVERWISPTCLASFVLDDIHDKRGLMRMGR